MTSTVTSGRTYVPCGHEQCHQYVSVPLGSILADVRCSGHAPHCPHNVLMQLDDSFTSYYGLDTGAYNMICTSCGRLRWGGGIPPKSLRTPGWDKEYEACGYLTGPQVLLPPFKLPS